MQKLSEVSEIKKAFRHVKQTENIQIVFKCARRDLPKKQGKKYVLFPVLYPVENRVAEYFVDMAKLGYDTGALLRNGFVLFCNKLFVPADLVPKGLRPKNPTVEFENQLVKNLTPETFIKVKENWSGYVRSQWNEAEAEDIISDFYYVDDEMGKDMNKFANAVFGE